MRLENWAVSGTQDNLRIWGNIFEDEKNRFTDGTFVRTSSIKSKLKDIKEGFVVETRNSKYILGKPVDDSVKVRAI